MITSDDYGREYNMPGALVGCMMCVISACAIIGAVFALFRWIL